MAVRGPGAVQRLPGPSWIRAESAPNMIGPITLGVKRTGERSAGKPHAAFDVAGAGDVAWSRAVTLPEETASNREHNLDLHRRASPRPYRFPKKLTFNAFGEARGERSSVHGFVRSKSHCGKSIRISLYAFVIIHLKADKSADQIQAIVIYFLTSIDFQGWVAFLPYLSITVKCLRRNRFRL